jgi:Family of unknown function (DUF5955)
MTENHGIVNVHSNVSGPQAAGPFASAEQTVNQPSGWPTPDAEALAEAVRNLRDALVRLRAEDPQALDEADAGSAELQLRGIAELATTPAPSHEVLKRRLGLIKGALGEASALTTALAVLETAVRKLIGI